MLTHKKIIKTSEGRESTLPYKYAIADGISIDIFYSAYISFLLFSPDTAVSSLIFNTVVTFASLVREEKHPNFDYFWIFVSFKRAHDA